MKQFIAIFIILSALWQCHSSVAGGVGFLPPPGPCESGCDTNRWEAEAENKSDANAYWANHYWVDAYGRSCGQGE